ncbi:copper ion binding / methyltransferase isoform X2 [Tasmannia lanceolata]|uniref:copper ion binding / methyltransferase isoform X2 n=1 Tax=Tasmannia lanceolata TaxID=3420 RepID=UPI00406419EB
MAGLIPETVSKLFTPETLRSAAKQSEGIHLVSLRLRRAIKKFLRDREDSHMNRKVLSLSESFNGIKDVNLQLCSSTSRELVEDPLKSMESSKRWKIKSSYGDIGFKYRDDETLAYVAARMPAVYSACHRVLREVDREDSHMNRKVLSLSESFNGIKDVNLQLCSSTSRELVEDPLKSMESSKRWKIKSSYGDIGFKYRDDETLAYVAARMPAVYSACHRVLREVDREDSHMNRKVLSLSESFNGIKDVNLQLCSSTSRELVEDPLKSMESSKRWKIKSSYGDIGFKYRDDETLAYVAARMPAVYSACHRVLREVRRRLPDFSPARVLDFGSGTGSALWALREVWPQSLESVNLIEPSKAMQRACQSLLQDLKDLPLIHSYDSIQALTQKLLKPDRVHDLVIASYVLGEIPSLKDRITIVRQLWDLTRDVLVLVEPGTPQGSSIICQMRSHILWMEKRKCRKSDNAASEASMDTRNTPANTAAVKSGAFVVAPCAHDGACPLENSGKYCHFVQRLERTSSQRAYKRSKGEPLRGFEDEKFCFVALRRGERPREAWPLDGMKFDTLKEQHAKRNPEDLIIDFEDQFGSEFEDAPYEEEDLSPTTYASDFTETDTMNENEELDEKEAAHADLGSGWGRIIFSPVRRGKQVSMDVCRSTKRDGSEGSFHRVVITQSKNPTLHLQARRSLWGDLWPF